MVVVIITATIQMMMIIMMIYVFFSCRCFRCDSFADGDDEVGFFFSCRTNPWVAIVVDSSISAHADR